MPKGFKVWKKKKKNKKPLFFEKLNCLKKIHTGILPALPLSPTSVAVPSHSPRDGKVGPQSKLELSSQVKKRKTKTKTPHSYYRRTLK